MVIKYAITVLTPFDRENIIPFFEKHYPNCNGFEYSELAIKIGETWAIEENGTLNWMTNEELEDFNYTVLQGVPKNLEMPSLEIIKTREKELENVLRDICYELTGEQEAEDELEKGLGIRLSSLVIRAKQLLNK